jgi:protein involved in polysaccharide export with SLBB domain
MAGRNKHRIIFFRLLCGFLFSAFLTIFCGCSNDALDPTQIGRFRPVPVVNVILDSLGVADEPDPAYAGAEDPKPTDVIPIEQDYTFGPGDTVRISIYELQAEARLFVDDFVVTETGKISIPDVGIINAQGLTESKLEAEIRDILSPSILRNPAVKVTLINSQRRQFAISGRGIGRPNRYPIPRTDYRLSEAIALAGGVAEFNVSYIYISRRMDENPALEQAAGTEVGPSEMQESQVGYGDERYDREYGSEQLELKTIEPDQEQQNETPKKTSPQLEPDQELMEMLSPYASKNRKSQIVIASAEMASIDELESLAAPEDIDIPENNNNAASNRAGDLQRNPNSNQQSRNAGSNSRVEWIFRDGKWEPVYVDEAGVPQDQEETADQSPREQLWQRRKPSGQTEQPRDEQALEGYGFEQMATAGPAALNTRVIKIPVDKLLAGDPRYDIIIRPGDSIVAPVDVIGEFSIMGNVNAQGYVSLTGRKMTLKQAIAAAGGLGPLAYPKKVEVIRRIGENKEEIVMVDLDKIAKGLQPDFFIKPDDLINVGTHGTSRWLAVLRNAFRATYGFGFTYDRNFATRDFGNDPFPGHIGPLNEIF